MNNRQARERTGFTLIELLVSMVLVGILLSLVLVGIQQSRAASRRIDCLNNLKQCGLGIHDYAEVHGEYPVEFGDKWPARLYSTYGFPLPDNGRVPTEYQGFRCPEGGRLKANDGTRYRGSSDYRNGFSGGPVARRPPDIVDGFSTTAAMSEVTNHERWWLDRHVEPGPGCEEDLVDACRNHRTSTRPEGDGTNLEGYDHFLTPNQPSCWSTDRAYPGFNHHGVFPASSDHAGGVNVLFIDGHARFVSDSIDWDAWKAVGTINGRESVSSF